MGAIYDDEIIRVDFPEPPPARALGYYYRHNVLPPLSCNLRNQVYLMKLTFWHISSATISLR